MLVPSWALTDERLIPCPHPSVLECFPGRFFVIEVSQNNRWRLDEQFARLLVAFNVDPFLIDNPRLIGGQQAATRAEVNVVINGRANNSARLSKTYQ